MKKKNSNYTLLLLLAVLFAAPGITAYVFYQHPSWLGASTVNKGHLITQPVILDALDEMTKWRLIYWSPGTCDKACLDQLDSLAKARLALGRQLYHVDLYLVLGEQAQPLTPEVESLLTEWDFKVTHLPAVSNELFTVLSADAKVLMANPDKYLILEYSAQANPDDVYKDLKRLLNNAK